MRKQDNDQNEQLDVLELDDLEQVRVLADPLRLSIVEKLCEDELTTKQVAEALGEKPTKLYHHVEALERVGLIRETRTKRNRGTLERYYRAVARRFKTNAKLFVGDDSKPDIETLQSVVTTILETTGRELSGLAAAGGNNPSDEGVLSFLQLETDEKAIARIRRRLQKLQADVQKLEEEEEDASTGPTRKYRLTIAFYPIDGGGEEP